MKERIDVFPTLLELVRTTKSNNFFSCRTTFFLLLPKLFKKIKSNHYFLGKPSFLKRKIHIFIILPKLLRDPKLNKIFLIKFLFLYFWVLTAVLNEFTISGLHPVGEFAFFLFFFQKVSVLVLHKNSKKSCQDNYNKIVSTFTSSIV